MLSIIATPIGNLKDITLRAVETLEEIDVLLCEDTRNTGLLLQNLGIKNKPRLESFYDEIEEQKIPSILRLLDNGVRVGLVSDAGTPLISDPGWKLIRKCQEKGLAYTSLPGPSAVLNSLILSGLATDRFCFLGFLPKKDSKRKEILKEYANLKSTKIVYESPFRVKDLVKEITEIYGEGVQIKICREMTKKFEEVLDGREEITKTKGEFVVVFR